MAVPLLGDLPATRTRYEPGDRIISRISTEIDYDQFNRLRKQVLKFCQAEVNLFVINVSKYGFLRIRPGQPDLILAQRSPGVRKIKLGLVSVDLAQVDFAPGDTLVIEWPKNQTVTVENRKAIQRWAGLDVELVFVYYDC
jgi:hypothetical protein